MALTVTEATSLDDELFDAVVRLVPQLSSSPPPNRDQLAQLITDPATKLLVARHDARIVAMMTLVVFRLPTGVRAWVEDVVVDEDARGAGVAAALITEAVALAKRLEARTIDLTSRPEREAANRLYLRLGFERRATNVYRHPLGG